MTDRYQVFFKRLNEIVEFTPEQFRIVQEACDRAFWKGFLYGLPVAVIFWSVVCWWIWSKA